MTTNLQHTVLIVDDSPTMRSMVQRALTEGGYRVVAASCPTEALQCLRGETVQAILSDVNMPEMDGINFVRRVREDPRYARTPILMVTTENGAEMKAAGKGAGATGWIVKPFDAEQLRNVVGMVIRRLSGQAR
jgi:two-component system, chemotaxis family, chemotaxis protein CheY